MSRYIDRLPPGSLVQFRAHQWYRGDRFVEPEALETALIDLAKKLPTLDATTRLDKVVRLFGEAEAIEALHVIEAIQADLDHDAEVAGDPVHGTPPTPGSGSTASRCV